MARLMGIETEYGLWIEGMELCDMVAASRALVHEYAGPCVTAWNYGFEDPRRDMRGFTVSELSRDPDDTVFDSAGPRFSSLADEHADRVLPNGARFYNDHGHPEYSTPECTSLRDIVAHDRAGERVVLDCARRYSERTGRAVRILKNNTDFHGASYGAHESFLLRRDVSVDALIAALAPFLVTRQVFAGGGKIGMDREANGKPRYQISQRAEFVDVVASVDTLHRRPLINTRDEPHAAPELYRRLHVIVGDANMSEWATAMKVGTLALVLDLVEAGWQPGFELTEPVAAVRAVALDPSLSEQLPLRSAKPGQGPLTALQIQRGYLEAARNAASSLPDRDWVLTEWSQALDDLESAPQRAADRVDWVAKLQILQDFETMGADPVSVTALQSVDLAYHDLSPDSGLYGALADAGRVRRIVAAEDINTAATTPPCDTRASVRGHFVARHADAVTAVGWNGIAFRHRDEEMVFDMNKLVDGSLGSMNNQLRQARTLDDTVAVLRRYRAG